MKYQLYFTIILFACIFNFSAFGQESFDCIDAIEVCDNSTLSIDYEDVIGNEIEEVDDFYTLGTSLLFFLDENTIWMKYNFKTDGDFLFTITSSLMEDDIDFVVFTSPTESCSDLEAIRCMFFRTKSSWTI